MIYYNTITEKMRTVAKIINEYFPSDFYLAGGTALSLQIGHRDSVDLDYFINKDIDTNELKNVITKSFQDKKVDFVFEQINTLWCIIDGVKVSFISRFDNLIEEVLVVDDFKLASIKDITLMKLATICRREEYKDYFDLACIAQMTDVRSWISWWQEIYPNNDPISFMVALGAVDQVESIALNIEEKFKIINPKIILSKATAEISDFIKK